MDGTWLGRALLAAALGWGVGVGLARADAPLTPMPAAAPAPQPAVVVINGIIYSSTGVAAAAVPAAVPAPACSGCAAAAEAEHKGEHPHSLRSMGESHPIATFWHDHKPVGCWTHFNNYSCSTWASEYAFIFGSCRNFFGEACMGKPEPAFPGEQPPKNICPNCQRP